MTIDRKMPEAAQMLRPSVGPDGEKLRHLLASKSPTELSTHDINSVVEGNLWMLGPEAFRYFLPAFLRITLASYGTVSVFASELVGALTEPSRADVEDAQARLPAEVQALLGQQQQEWFDSGTPSAIFKERVEGLTHVEGAAVLAFFDALTAARGADFPFDELQQAVERYWSRYREKQGRRSG